MAGAALEEFVACAMEWMRVCADGAGDARDCGDCEDVATAAEGAECGELVLFKSECCE